MKKLMVVLFMVMVASGCAQIDYSKNQGALSAYRAGQADRAAYNQAVLEQQAYRDGLNGGVPQVSLGVGYRSNNFRAFGNINNGYGGYVNHCDWRNHLGRRW